MKNRDVSGTQQGYLLHREQIGLQMGTQAMDGLTKGLQGPGALCHYQLFLSKDVMVTVLTVIVAIRATRTAFTFCSLMFIAREPES